MHRSLYVHCYAEDTYFSYNKKLPCHVILLHVANYYLQFRIQRENNDGLLR